MKKLTISLMILFITTILPVDAAPDYAKWGVVAMKETQKRYSASIIDYKHIGRTELTSKISEEKFKLWLRNKDGSEFGVYVSIRFNPLDDTIQSIQFTESNS